MTREEAIGLIESARKTMYLPKSKEYISDFGYALEMAIKALEQEPCEDAISRKVVKAEYKRRFEANLIDESRGIDWSEYVNCEPFNEFIDSIPPVNTQANTGHWLRVTDKTGHLVWECDKCSWQQSFNTNFCPDCGAKMLASQESEG